MDNENTQEHEDAYCSISQCQEYATRFICSKKEDAPVLGIKPHETFYLCDEHAEMLSPEDDHVVFIHPNTRELIQRELGVYACADTCEVCWG